MSCYTKKERRKIYKEVLESYKRRQKNFYSYISFVGFCASIRYSVSNFFDADFSKENFPELYEFKPKHNNGYWFPDNNEYGYTIRVMILLEAIKLTE